MKKLFIRSWVVVCTLMGWSYTAAADHKVSELLQEHAEDLKNTSVYIIATAWNEERFAGNFVRSMQDTKEDLETYGVDFHVSLRCDGRKEDWEAFTKEFEKVNFPKEHCQLSLNEKNLGVFHSRLALLRDIRTSVEADLSNGKNVYVIPMDSDDIWRKNGILTLVVSGLHENADYVFTQPCYVFAEEDQRLAEKSKPLEIGSLEVLGKKDKDYWVFEEGFAFFGFKASCLYGENFDARIEKFKEFPEATWQFFNRADLFKEVVFCDPKGDNQRLVLYAQHGDSSLSSLLLHKLGDLQAEAVDALSALRGLLQMGHEKCPNIPEINFMRYRFEDRQLFLYRPDILSSNEQFSQYIPITGGQNSSFTKDFFVEKMKGQHRWWQAFYQIAKAYPFFQKIFSKEPFCLLVQEDQDKDLSEEKVMRYFGEFYQKITTLDPLWAQLFFVEIARLKEWMQESIILWFEGEHPVREAKQAYFLFGFYDEKAENEDLCFLSIPKKEITEEMLYECLKNMHVYANLFSQILEKDPSLRNEAGEGKRNILCQQDPTKPLSKEFMQEHFKEILQVLLKK